MLAAVASVLITAGFIFVGRRVAGKQAPAIEQAAGFIVAIGSTAALIHTLALTHQLHLPLLRAIAALLVICGVWEMASLLPVSVRYAKNLPQARPFTHGRQRWAHLVTGIILSALFLAAVAPATDGDSFDYHLGVPLDWLANTAATVRLDWLHAHLIGLGEMINLLGLAAGTSSLGAVTQYAGLIIMLVAVKTVAHPSHVTLGRLLVVTSPVLLFLIPNQKPQYLPFAATTLALVVLLHAHQQPGKAGTRTYWLAFGTAAFAIGCKYPSIMTGGIVMLVGVWVAWRKRQTLIALLIAAGSVGLLAGGVWLRNYLFYGDPLSPFLHNWLTPDNVLGASFAEHLREYETGVVTWQDYLLFPVRLIGVTSPAALTSALGIGTVALLTADWRNTYTRSLLLLALLTTIIMVATNQLTPRFFVEPYLWAALAVVHGARVRGQRWLSGLLLVQGAGVAAMAVYAAVILFPGALSWSLFDDTLTHYAAGYETGKWLDETLPSDAVIFTDLRTGAVLPRPFVSADIGRYWYQVDAPPEERLALFLAVLDDNLQARGVTHLVMREATLAQTPYNQLSCLGAPLATAAFSDVGRNPFGRDQAQTTYTIVPITPIQCDFSTK